MEWRIHDRTLDLTHCGLVMGVLNVTPDSFSDGGSYIDPAAALAHAREMITEGVDILDIGGESTRPGAAPVEAGEELRRVLPVIEALAGETNIPLSIDTSKAAVAREALVRGCSILNDVTGLRGDPDMMALAASSGAGVILMHMLGEPRTMQQAPVYGDVVAEISVFFRQRLAACVESGLDVRRVVLDPGIGFGKTAAHNLEILRRLPELTVHQRPLLLGVSRKSFLAATLGESDPVERLWPTVALTSLGRERGARIFRVHDVRPNHEALRMTEAMLTA